MTPLDDKLNLRQLRILYVLLSEQSVTRAALRLRLGQPAVSVALAQLRKLTGDTLLVRGKNGSVLTPRAVELLDICKRVLADLDKLIQPDSDFDPSITLQTFSLGSADYLDLRFLPELSRRLQRLAPQSRLAVYPIRPQAEHVEQLERGELDAVVGNADSVPGQLHLRWLFDDEIVCVMHARHRLARKPLSVEDYQRWPHLVPIPHSSAHPDVVDTYLSKAGLSRQRRCQMPYFGIVPLMLEDSDLIFTTGRQLALSYQRIAKLCIQPMPLPVPPLRFYMTWHERSHQSPAGRWFRQQIVEVCDELRGAVTAARS